MFSLAQFTADCIKSKGASVAYMTAIRLAYNDKISKGKAIMLQQ